MTLFCTRPQRLAAIFLALITFGFAGCAVSAKRVNNLRVGMTKPEVMTTLGQPYSAGLQNNVETLYFRLSVDRIAEGMFIGAARPLNIGVRFYKVELVNGQVRSYSQTEKP